MDSLFTTRGGLTLNADGRQALEVILAEASPRVIVGEWGATFDTIRGVCDLSEGVATRWLKMVETIARALHRDYEDECNRPRSEREEAQTAAREDRLRVMFAEFGLGLYLQADPRGNPVGILTPKTGRFNTLGGAECGWRL